jgi:hypothetical protein
VNRTCCGDIESDDPWRRRHPAPRYTKTIWSAFNPSAILVENVPDVVNYCGHNIARTCDRSFHG